MKKSAIKKTNFSLPKNSFIIGLGSVVNIFGGYFEYNTHQSPKEIDTKALQSDWQSVGEDIKKSLNESFKKVKLC